MAQLSLDRVPAWEIAKREGVSPATISRDMATVRAEWRRAACVSIGTLIEQEIAALDADEKNLRALMAREKKGVLKAKIFDRVIKIMERRSKLRGLDAPEKHKHEIAPGAPFSAGGEAAAAERRELRALSPEVRRLIMGASPERVEAVVAAGMRVIGAETAGEAGETGSALAGVTGVMDVAIVVPDELQVTHDASGAGSAVNGNGNGNGAHGGNGHA